MLAIPILIAGILLILGFGGAIVLLESIHRPRYLFAHTPKPLDALMQGVRWIEGGDLDSPVAYEEHAWLVMQGVLWQ